MAVEGAVLPPERIPARELKTLGRAADRLLQGRVAEALDILMQRMQGIEVAVEQGSWGQARWLELLPPSEVASWSRETLRLAQREELVEQRLREGPLGTPSPQGGPGHNAVESGPSGQQPGGPRPGRRWQPRPRDQRQGAQRARGGAESGGHLPPPPPARR